MTRKILVPMDESKPAEKALEYAIETHPEADITVLNVIHLEPLPGEGSVITFDDDIMEGAYGHAEEIFERASEVAGEAGYDRELETDTVEGKPSRAIVDYVEDEEIDAIVMGSHGRDGTARILLGSVAETVVRRAPVPVTVVR
ncbi:MAG: universal stress protein [Haloferacaceae archaeon]